MPLARTAVGCLEDSVSDRGTYARDWTVQVMQKLETYEFVPVWNAIVYVVCLYMLGLGIWKALLIMVIATICVSLNYGSRWVLRGGFALLVLTALVFLEILPPAAEWREQLAEGFGNLLAAFGIGGANCGPVA